MIHESTKAVAEMKIPKKMFVFSLHPICRGEAGVLQLSVVRAVNHHDGLKTATTHKLVPAHHTENFSAIGSVSIVTCPELFPDLIIV